MPYVVQSQGGALAGKRVLDIACNSGFWSIQCALLGAEVVGIDARAELIEQANLLKSITGADKAEFRRLDFWEMSPETLGGTFDVVLNLGFLYHVPKPLEALDLTKLMSRSHILLDTTVHPSSELAIYLKWEEPFDIRMAAQEGVTGPAHETRRRADAQAPEIRQIWIEIPVRTGDLPIDYLPAGASHG